MRSPMYLLYGVTLLAMLGWTSYNRMPLFAGSVNEVKNVPKTVRDNPGAYRSIYGGYSHYVGGK
jgi:hypothetical protein